MNGFVRIIGAMCDYKTAEIFPQLDSAAADCSAVELDDIIVRRTSFPPDEFSAGRDSVYMIDCNTEWGFPRIDSAVADGGVVGLVDLVFRRTYFPLDELSAGPLYMAGPVDWPVSMQSISAWVTRFRIFPKTWTMLSMAGSPSFSLDRECGSSALSSSSSGG